MPIIRELRFPPDPRFPIETRADPGRVATMIAGSAWLSIALVAAVLAVCVLLVMRLRRTIRGRTSMRLLLNTLAAVMVVMLLAAGFGAVEILVGPGATLQTFYGLSRVPAPQTELLILSGACAAAAVGELVLGKVIAR
ncbi:MAG TPA: hypothetical protein VKH35_04460 [Thermoanaerobaculia bacterium]|jgi:hypothetical protein|nr:hypothetical protein [Thermoanaerobaculia bacterium]